ncbi:MAG: PEGA domain-containing protein [Polyangiaceae bacterium]
MIRRVVIHSLVAVMLLQSAPVYAQKKAPAGPARSGKTVRDELPESAIRDWDSAKLLFGAGDWQGAVAEFRRAYELSKNPRVLMNVAICEKNLRRYSRAVAVLKQEISEGTGRVPNEELEQAREYIATMEPLTSTVSIKTTEIGATLFIDNVESGTTPFASPVAIDVGTHTLRLHKDGFRDASQTLTVTGGVPASVDMPMDPLLKRVLVDVRVVGSKDASVWVDGVELGAAPFHGEIEAGKHTFEARAAGFATARDTRDLVYKEPAVLVLTLDKERHEGKVKVVATPAGGVIEVDGQVVGTAPWEGSLPTGGHHLVIKKSGYDTYSQEIALSDNQTREVNATLTSSSKYGWVWWVAGAAVLAGAGATVTYFATNGKAADPPPGNLNPGLVKTSGFAF